MFKKKWIRIFQVLVLMIVTQMLFLNCSNFEVSEQMSSPPSPLDQGENQNSNPPEANNGGSTSYVAKRVVTVRNSTELLNALASAQPGDSIELSSGVYQLNESKVRVNRPGTAAEPVYLRAQNLGDAQIHMCNAEGFFVSAPYWVFENLEVRGVCLDGVKNEHAFHIVGTGDHVILKNNRVVNFMSHVKTNCDINGTSFRCPTGIQFLNNRWYNTTPVPGSAPFNVLNIDGSNETVIRGNVFHDFASANTSKSATAIYTKMHSNNVLVEQNLVVCEQNLVTGSNRRGINVGDALDGNPYCLNQDCTSFNGVYRNNIVMNCQGSGNSFGIGVINQDTSSFLHNTVINTKHQWYDQTAPVTNTFKNNFWTSGFNGQDPSIRPQQLGNFLSTNAQARDVFLLSTGGNFQLVPNFNFNQLIQEKDQRSLRDFCGNERLSLTSVGAIEYQSPHVSTCLSQIQSLILSLQSDL